jgi:hypothetical protein
MRPLGKTGTAPEDPLKVTKPSNVVTGKKFPICGTIRQFRGFARMHEGGPALGLEQGDLGLIDD